MVPVEPPEVWWRAERVHYAQSTRPFPRRPNVKKGDGSGYARLGLGSETKLIIIIILIIIIKLLLLGICSLRPVGFLVV